MGAGGFAAASEPEVRENFAGMWEAVSDTTELDAVTVKTFLAFGMLLNNGAALEVREVEEPWALGVRTRIQPGLFTQITSETNR